MDVNHEWVDCIFKNVITGLDCATEVLMSPFRTIFQSEEGGLFHHLNQNILVQCRHLIPALNAWAARAYYTTACPIASQFSGHCCIDYLEIERSFGLQVTCVIGVLGCYF